MKTLREELISLARELLGPWRQPARGTGDQTLQPGDGPRVAVLPEPHAEALQLEALAREFPCELYAQLLIELPDHRRSMAKSFAAGDHRRLRECVHRLLGAAAYCQARELEHALRELRLTLRTDERGTIEHSCHRAIQVMDNMLHDSGLCKRRG